jgi:DNA adenine methylase
MPSHRALRHDPVRKAVVDDAKAPLLSEAHAGADPNCRRSGDSSESPSDSSETRASIRPVVKWAGGKRQLLHQLRRFFPTDFERYFEPFVGSGAVFLDLYGAGAIGSRPALLSDSNADLIGCYDAIVRDVAHVIRELRKLAVAHEARGDQHYYEIRDQRFNPLRRRGTDRAGAQPAKYPANLAAMFIYLNRTGFNGLYRLNARGDFNVPVGRYTNPQVCDAVNLRAVATALRSSNVHLRHGSFEATVSACRSGDFVYFDPPYAPLSNTSSFTSYTAQRFSDFDQQRLQKVVVGLARRGCFVVLSNSTAPIITELYERDHTARRAGLRAHRVPARRLINSNASRRGLVEEYIITNVTPTP